MDSLIGKKLDGRYQIEELVGTGGMANVYRANDLKENRTVAVKILKEEFLHNDELVRRFKNESKAIAVLNHPNIVKVFDISVSDKLQFIVMEYIDGITLREYIDERNEPLTYKETLFFISETLQALSHAHEKGVVHRDIKPQNIMLLGDGTIRVMDFGIARFSRAEGAIQSDKAIGSVHYISPEQAKGDDTDAKSDIYSIGVMMYEMLCGQLPFESDTPVSVAIKQISDIATPLRKIKADIPEALESITAKAMAKDPIKRYASANEMLGDIEEFKKNPSVRFDYKYLNDNAQVRYINKIVNKPKNKAAANSDGTKTAKKKHHYGLPILAGMAVAFAIGAAVLVYMIFKLSGNPLFNDKQDVDLLDFVGKNAADIKKDSELKSKFTFKIEEKYNDEKEAGIIYDQFPKGGKKVKEGSTVTLRVSKGMEMTTMPDVSNMSKDDAQQKLKDMKLHMSVRREVTDKVPVGKVVKTEPTAGEQVKVGSTVVLYISQTKVDLETTVPEIVGIPTLSDVSILLTKAKLNLGTITKVESELPIETVIEQSPAPGEVVQIGTAVNVSISDGLHERTKKVSIHFDSKVNKGIWTASFNGGTETFETQDGVATVWTLSFTSTGGEQMVSISGPGGSKDVKLNFLNDEYAEQEISFSGTFIANVPRSITINFSNKVNTGTWTVTLDGALVDGGTIYTLDGAANSVTVTLNGKGKQTLTVSGPGGTQSVGVDFTATGADPAPMNFTGTFGTVSSSSSSS
ncbi:MAG: Stk1 family PASTA domain-containing Ser/Thr kinase [Oscillospiraceae bacterium]